MQVSDAGAEVVTLFQSTKKSYIASGDAPPHVSFTARWLDPLQLQYFVFMNESS